MSKPNEALLSKIESAAVRVGIIGLGYVGLPLARAFAEKRIAVLGFDVDPLKVAKLQSGQSYIGHIHDATIRQMREQRFEATSSFDRLDEPDAIIICVPTPLTEARARPDLHREIRRGHRGTVCARGSSSSWKAPPTRERPARSFSPS